MRGQKLLTLEAMKMVTTVCASKQGAWPKCWSSRGRGRGGTCCYDSRCEAISLAHTTGERTYVPGA